MLSLPNERREQLRKIWDEKGRKAAKMACNDVSEMILLEDISVDYYVHEARAIGTELSKGYSDYHYLHEKITHMVEMMMIATRGLSNENKWKNAYEGLKKI